MYEVALALYEGARKYGAWNWRKQKVDEVIYVDAAIRHLNQWLAGEDIDPDSGLPHISKAIAGLVILRDAQHHGCSIDTRREPQEIDLADIVERMGVINEKYPNPVEPTNTGCCKGGAVPVPSDTVPEPLPKEYTRDTTHLDMLDKHSRSPDFKQYSYTVVGGGSYEIKESDVGKRVGLSSGKFTTITEFDEGDAFPVKTKGGPCSTTIEGGEYNSDRTDGDIVRVYH